MPFERGDHVCALYSTTAELTREVAPFLAEGLRRRERCWYVAAGTKRPRCGLRCGRWGLTWRLKRSEKR